MDSETHFEVSRGSRGAYFDPGQAIIRLLAGTYRSGERRKLVWGGSGDGDLDPRQIRYASQPIRG